MMEYLLSVDQFKRGKMFDSNGKLSHQTTYQFKLFPFIAQTRSNPVLSLDNIIGCLLCKIEGKVPKAISADELINRIKEDTEIEPGQEEKFAEVVRQLFYDSDGNIRPLNLKMLEQRTMDSSESRVAEYLVDVLGDKATLAQSLSSAHALSVENSNVLEKLVLEKLSSTAESQQDAMPYFRVVYSLKQIFEEDFKYILENSQRARDYLVPLFEFYFFTYTAQVSMQLNNFLDGTRMGNIPLYFCLEWEKTSQSRLCFNEGWQRLRKATEKIFAHAVTLEIINQTEPGCERYDYIKLRELIDSDEEMDFEVSQKIMAVTRYYRSCITDCPEMNETDEPQDTHTADGAVRYLFDSIKKQFENTRRIRAYSSYASKFEKYCYKYLKSRGRSGLMLNLSEETLIFLTRLCIKNKEQVRLKDVFKALEARGVYLDDISKEQVTLYYEKLNLIEKKSDSGDAKYVKRIL